MTLMRYLTHYSKALQDGKCFHTILSRVRFTLISRGYRVSEIWLTTIHSDTMVREYRSCLLISSEKASSRRDGELFRRHVDALAKSPHQWFRMRDADALARYTIAAALACNDLDDVWFTDEQFEILAEIGEISLCRGRAHNRQAGN